MRFIFSQYAKSLSRSASVTLKPTLIYFLSSTVGLPRFAIFLLEESEKRKSEVVHLTHEQMARYMGTAREVVTRLIKYFNQEGWTTSGRGYLRIEDREALRRLAGTY